MFYRLFINLKKVDGTPYKVKTLYNILASFNRYFKRVRDVDLINDSSFKQFRSVFDGLLRELQSVEDPASNKPSYKILTSIIRVTINLKYTTYFMIR